MKILTLLLALAFAMPSRSADASGSASARWEYALFSMSTRDLATPYAWETPQGIQRFKTDGDFLATMPAQKHPNILNACGAVGWELVAVIRDSWGFTYYFKRPAH